VDGKWRCGTPFCAATRHVCGPHISSLLLQVEEDNERLSAALDEQQLRMAAQQSTPTAPVPPAATTTTTAAANPAPTRQPSSALRSASTRSRVSGGGALLDAPLAIQLLSHAGVSAPHQASGAFFRTLEAHLAVLPRKEWLTWLHARAIEESEAAEAAAPQVLVLACFCLGVCGGDESWLQRWRVCGVMHPCGWWHVVRVQQDALVRDVWW
jgi:pyruvate/2-oxoglutarate dehydrogenase complex dihydrolipoamide acyltransferase (E2) component